MTRLLKLGALGAIWLCLGYVAWGQTLTAPIIDPTSGTYGPGQLIAMSAPDLGATICYAVNTTPTAPTPGTCGGGSTTYTGVFTISSSQSISALATKSGFANSSVTTNTYTINSTLDPPRFLPAPGSYMSSQLVTISTSAGSTICYGINTTPTATVPGTCDVGSNTYTAAIDVNSTQTVNAIATRSGFTNSSVATAAYVIGSSSCVAASQVTLTGNLRSANGLPSSNNTITLTPSQQGFISGCGVNLQVANICATSVDGSVVQTPNPLTATSNTTGGMGSLPSGTYYTFYEFYDALGHTTLPSPESRTILSVTGSLVVNPPPSGIPSTAVGMDVFISTTSGTETLQGQTTGSASFIQSQALTAGGAPATTNNTVCAVTANDSVWPTGTGYIVTMVDPDGNGIPGYPMQWQLMGAGSSINLSNGLPYYHGVVTYPVPVLTQPQNHGQQSIAGPLNMTGYNVVNVGKLGVGTQVPGWSIDVENGIVNASGGYLINGNLPVTGQCAGSTDGVAVDGYLDCITSGSLFYQTVDLNSSPLTQRPILNFSSRFAVTDSSSPAQTNVDLPSTVSAGSCTYCGLSYDAYGRITAASSGTNPTGSGSLANPGWYASPFGWIFEMGNSTYTGSAVTVTLPHTFPNQNVAVTLTGQFESGTYGVSIPQLVYGSQTTSSFQWTCNENPCYVTWQAIGW